MKHAENPRIDDQRIAVLATHGFEESELFEPVRALRDAGGRVDVIAPDPGRIRAWKEGHWGGEADVDRTLDEAEASEYDALVLPGGVMNPDKLRMDERAVAFVRAFARASKPIASICHGPWMLIEADAVRGREVTSWPSLRRDLENAGARWTDREVVADDGLITSRKPGDLPAFCDAALEAIAAASSARVG